MDTYAWLSTVVVGVNIYPCHWFRFRPRTPLRSLAWYIQFPCFVFGSVGCDISPSVIDMDILRSLFRFRLRLFCWHVVSISHFRIRIGRA